MRSMSHFVMGFLGVLAGAALVGGIVWATDDGTGSSNPPATTSQPVSGDNADTGGDAAAADFTELYARVRNSVVRITTGSDSGDIFGGPRDGLGSGIVLDEEGHILTNYHVVRGFDEVSVTFADGTTVDAEVVGTDPGNDIALVRADADASLLEPAALGDSSSVQVGELVAAIGSPFGLDGTFTTGVVSGLNRTLPSSADGRPIRGLLQTDTAVNPGNSGGALFNMRGEVIGINTAIENPGGGGFAGVAYAVPINTPKRFLTQLVAGETIEHARLGISGQTLPRSEAERLGVDHGVAVATVEPGSAADDAGLRSASGNDADVILEIDGQPMKTFEELADYIDSRNVGDEVTIKVLRDGEELELTARLKSWDSTA